MPPSHHTIDQAAVKIEEVQLALTGSEQILAARGGIKRIRLMAPTNSSGVATNTHVVFFGTAGKLYDWLAADGSRDTMIHIDDPSKIVVKGTNGEALNYRLEF